jgi:transposase InsO family protein
VTPTDEFMDTREGHLSDRKDVRLAGRVQIRILRRAGTTDVGDRTPTGVHDSAHVANHVELSHRTYGYRRIHAALVRQSEQASPELVGDLMRELGRVACPPRPFRPTTTVAGQDPAGTPDLVDRDVTAAAPGETFVGEITDSPTGEGWLYLATIIDCDSNMVVGWSMADHLRASLVVSALDMAATKCRSPTTRSSLATAACSTRRPSSVRHSPH